MDDLSRRTARAPKSRTYPKVASYWIWPALTLQFHAGQAPRAGTVLRLPALAAGNHVCRYLGPRQRVNPHPVPPLSRLSRCGPSKRATCVPSKRQRTSETVHIHITTEEQFWRTRTCLSAYRHVSPCGDTRSSAHRGQSSPHAPPCGQAASRTDGRPPWTLPTLRQATPQRTTVHFQRMLHLAVGQHFQQTIDQSGKPVWSNSTVLARSHLQAPGPDEGDSVNSTALQTNSNAAA